MTPRRKQRLTIVMVIFIALAAITGLIIYALDQNMDLFYTPTEIIHGKEDSTKPQIGQRLRVGGMVAKGSVVRDPNSLLVSFDLYDVGPRVTVVYEGILPDLFREGQGIVAQGILTDKCTIKATEVLAKHDENYVPIEVAEAMKKTHETLNYSTQQIEGSAQ